MYNYFCKDCGFRFKSKEAPFIIVADEKLTNWDIKCQHCKNYNCIEDTEENANFSIKELTDYENALRELNNE